MAAKMAKRKTKKVKHDPRLVHEVECKICGVVAIKSQAVTGYVCHECVVDSWDPPQAKKKRVGYPRGWKFMKQFVHADGTVFFKGEEQPKLKGTLSPTPIKKKVKDTRSKAQRAQEKQDLLMEINKLKKAIKKEKRVTYRRKLESQLKKLTKKL